VMSMPTLAPARRAIGTTIMGSHELGGATTKHGLGASAKDLPARSHQQQRVGEGRCPGAGSLVDREAGGQSRASRKRCRALEVDYPGDDKTSSLPPSLEVLRSDRVTNDDRRLNARDRGRSPCRDAYGLAGPSCRTRC